MTAGCKCGDEGRLCLTREVNNIVLELYTEAKIAEICSEIDRQWAFHLVARAAFPSRMSARIPKYSSPSFYSANGIAFSVDVTRLEPTMRSAIDDIGHWLNQNFVIRLFGILYESKIDVAGRLDQNDFTLIIATLRHKVGAHSRGHRNPSNSDVKEVTRLLKKYFGEGIDRADVERFNLSVTPVLEGLKDACLRYVRSLVGKQIPRRGQNAW